MQPGVIRLRTVVERKSEALPRYVVIPAASLARWRPTGTLVVEAELDGRDLGRRNLKAWGRGREVWFLDLTQRQCERAGVDTGDAIELVLRRADDGIPEELVAVIEASAAARRSWDMLSAGRRRQISEHVRAAKHAETRRRRARRAFDG